MTVTRALTIPRLEPDPNCVDNPAFRETLGTTEVSPLAFGAAKDDEDGQIRVRRTGKMVKMLRDEREHFDRLGTLNSVSLCQWRDNALDWVMVINAPAYPREGYQLRQALSLNVRFLAVSYLDLIIRSFDHDRLTSLNKLALTCALLYCAAKDRWEGNVLPWFYFHQIAQQFETDQDGLNVGAARGQDGLSASQLEAMVRLVHIHFMNLGTTYHMTTPLDFAREIIGRPGTVFGLNDIFEHKGCLPNLEGILKSRCKVDRSTFESLFSEFAMIYVRDLSLTDCRPSLCGAALIYITLVFISHRPIVTPIPAQHNLPLTPLLQAGQLDLLVSNQFGIVWSLANTIYRLRIDRCV